MERRNLDLGIALTPDQWEILERTAERLGPEDAGFAWDREDSEILVYVSDRDAPNHLRNLINREDRYGAHRRAVAAFHFNDGDPFASIAAPASAEQPVITEPEEEELSRELDAWVRNKWHELLRTSGIHYERGHIPGG